MKIFVVKGVAKGDRVYYEGLNFKIHAGDWLPNYECYFQVKKLIKKSKNLKKHAMNFFPK